MIPDPTHVALLIAQGESPTYIADRLGHESTRIVLDVYGHLYEDADAEVVDRLEEVRRLSRPDQASSSRARDTRNPLRRNGFRAWALAGLNCRPLPRQGKAGGPAVHGDPA
jgi:hypothetical protein